jgi:hypothetical protein
MNNEVIAYITDKSYAELLKKAEKEFTKEIRAQIKEDMKDPERRKIIQRYAECSKEREENFKKWYGKVII